MGYFPQTFADIARDPTGEALRVKLHVRLNDGAGGSPGTLLTVTDNQEILDVSTIERKRERSFGVIQGQAWQVQTTNIDLTMLAYSLPGCWACIEGGFPIADEWVVFAQGKISSFSTSTDGAVTIEVRDSVMDVLNFGLVRDIRFQNSGWVSELQVVRKEENSQGWDPSVGIAVPFPYKLDDETFQVVFTTDDDYQVLLEDGSVGASGNTIADLSVENLAGDRGVLTIPASGWSPGVGQYAAGDTFTFYTARPRTTDELAPVGMVRHLIEDIAGLTCHDVLNGADYSAPIYDSANWDSLASTSATIAGTWSKGARLVELIQDALKIVHGTIYPSPSGQVALWVLQPSTGGALILNGNPEAGPVDIIHGGYQDSLDDTITDVVFEYLALNTGEDASFSATIDLADSPLLERRTKTVKTSWEVRGLSMESAANLYLERNKDVRREHDLSCTLAGAVADLGGTIAIREASTGLSMAVVSTTDIVIDLLGNSAQVKAYNDPYVNQGFFIIGESLIGGSDLIA